MMSRVQKSRALYELACGVIPMGTQTHSKAPREALRDVEPCFLVKGKGCRVWDVDGNEYIDFRNGLGPVSLGYCFEAVDNAVKAQIDNGYIFSYAHPLEDRVARRLVDIIPCAEKVRFLKTGGEAMAATHRLARGFTGRDVVVTCGYHGWINTVTGKGTPKAIGSVYRQLPWGDVTPFEDLFRDMGDEIAAVSVACDYRDMEKGHEFLPALRALTEKYGALLIFDEIVTGFRLARAGAQEYFNVIPDLAVFAKGMSNGVPLSCYCGRADVMDVVKDVVISSTFGGDTLGLAACDAVLNVYEDEPVIETLWARGQQLHMGFNEVCAELEIPAQFWGMPPLGLLAFSHEDASQNAELFVQFNGEVLKRGVIIYSVCYPNYSHSEADIDEALGGMREALGELK
jgi:glutamate-1-semialdehyde 2,1-aminomutase